MVEKSKLKYFTEEDCKKIGDILSDKGMGSTRFGLAFNDEQSDIPVCKITVNGVGGIDFTAYDSDIDYLGTIDSEVYYSFFARTGFNKVEFNRTNIKKFIVDDDIIDYKMWQRYK